MLSIYNRPEWVRIGQSDQIGRSIAIWATFLSQWRQRCGPNVYVPKKYLAKIVVIILAFLKKIGPSFIQNLLVTLELVW